MNPDERSPGGDVPAQQPAGSDNSPVAHSQQTTPTHNPAQQEAAANLLRGQIDSLYAGGAVTPSQQPENTYHRTHTPNPAPEADKWKEYHSAWQNYYQKYYENYYTQAVSKATAAHSHTPQQPEHYFSQHNTGQPETAEELSNDEALLELRQKLLGRVQESAKKIRKSRHFIPIAAAIGVVLIFVFLQYNRVLFANVQAYISPGSIDPQNIVVDPSSDIKVSKEPRLIIPKINVDVPAIYDVKSDYDSQMAAMAKGVAHFSIPGASSHPGEIGNTVLSGHSSNDLFDTGDYKFIFAQLEKMKVGDSIYANYKGIRYTYVITKTEVVKPTEVSKLIYKTNKPILTLITCTPLGTALNRLLVTAEQVSPDPSKAQAAPAGSGEVGNEADPIPGSTPTFFERLFGGGGN